MKKSLFALAALGVFASAAQAQSSVTLYGILDVAVGTATVQGVGAPTFPATVDVKDPLAAGNSLTGMFNGGISPSRWGIKGSEDLGGGMKANFLLESGFDANSGQLNNGIVSQQAPGTTVAATSLNGQLFNRSAWVGLSDSKLGEIRLGRQYAPQFDIVGAYDPVQAAQLFSPIGFSGSTGGGGGVTDDLRRDNSVRYTNKIGNFNFGGMYQFVENSGFGSSYAVNAGYEAGAFGIQAAYQASKDVATAASSSKYDSISTALSQISSTNLAGVAYNSTSYMIAAKYKVTGEATVKAGYEAYTLSTASDAMAATTSLYGYTANVYSYTGPDQNVAVYWVGGDYQVTPALNLAAGYYNYNYSSFGASNVLNSAYQKTQEFYSFLADYALSKRTDIYAGAMFVNYSGDGYNTSLSYTAPNGTSHAVGAALNNSIYAVGIRHKF